MAKAESEATEGVRRLVRREVPERMPIDLPEWGVTTHAPGFAQQAGTSRSRG